MEKITLNGILVDKYTNFRKVLLDIEKNNIEIVKFDNNKFFCPSLELFFKLNCKKNVSIKKINQGLTMMEMNEIKLTDDPLILSDSDKYKVLLTLALINNCNNFVIVYPDLYLDDYNINLLLRILKKLSKEYKKNIYIITNDIDLLYRECDNLCIYNKNRIIFNGSRNNLYDEREILLNNNFCLPKILEFISLVESKTKIKLEPTFDIKELMKDIYRNV